jgi:hypothetical protein
MADDDTETQNAILEAMELGCWEPLHLKKVPKEGDYADDE